MRHFTKTIFIILGMFLFVFTSFSVFSCTKIELKKVKAIAWNINNDQHFTIYKTGKFQTLPIEVTAIPTDTGLEKRGWNDINYVGYPRVENSNSNNDILKFAYSSLTLSVKVDKDTIITDANKSIKVILTVKATNNDKNLFKYGISERNIYLDIEDSFNDANIFNQVDKPMVFVESKELKANNFSSILSLTHKDENVADTDFLSKID